MRKMGGKGGADFSISEDGRFVIPIVTTGIRIKRDSRFQVSLQNATTPDPKIRNLLAKQLKDVLLGRRSARVFQTRLFFQKFTDRLKDTSGDELWEDLLRTKYYFDFHLLLYLKNNDTTDDFPIIFYYADMPEILLEMLELYLSSDLLHSSAKMSSLPSLAIFILSHLFYMYSSTFTLVPERLFRDSEKTLLKVTEGAFGDKLMWYDKLSMIHFYGIGSSSRACIWFLHRHMNVVRNLFTFCYHGMEIIDKKLRNNEINMEDENLAQFLITFRDDRDVAFTAKYFGIYITNQAVCCFRNIIESTKINYKLFRMVSKEVVKSKVLEYFPYIVRNLMTWLDPGLYLGLFLAGVAHCLNIKGTIETIVMNDFSHAVAHQLPLGIETFHLWNHETRFPNTIAWLLLHSFSMSKKMGYDQCIYIICYILDKAEEKIVDQIVENFGLDLMDLAHLVGISYPSKTSVQSIILEAMLRHGRIQHKVYDNSDIVEGDLKPSEKMKDYILEAILFCKKAQCEASIPKLEMQRLAFEADKLKDQGNVSFKAGKYVDAIIKYTDSIALCPLCAQKKQAIYYSNRAECHLRCKNPKKAIHDCNRSLCLDTTAWIKVQLKRSKAYQKLGLSYPEWLGMQCLEKGWTKLAMLGGIDYQSVYESLCLTVGVLPETIPSSIEKKLYNAFYYDVLNKEDGGD